MRADQLVPPFYVIDMPLNESGEGPEMVQSQVRKIVYQIWNANLETVAEYYSPRKAELECRKLNERYDGKA